MAAKQPKGALRYFEQDGRFWEVFVDGTSVKTRSGKIGAKGQTRLKELKRRDAAEVECTRQIAEKEKAGFRERPAKVEVPRAPVPEGRRNAELEAAIVANPNDDAAYMVYADWLQDQGDPRGELIALQLRGSKAAKKLIEAHADYFLGPLQAHQQCHDGFQKKRDAFTWKNGFIHAARLAHNCYATEWKGSLARDVLEPLLAHPSGRFLVELTINENDDPTEDNVEDLIAVVAKQVRPTLRKVQIGDDVSQLSWYRAGDIGELWQAVPNLTHFGIESGEFELGRIELPNLVHAVFYTGGLSKAAAKSIAKARWPKVEHLEVYFGDSQYGGDTTVKDVLPLLERTDMPRLTYLGVKDAEYQDELVEAVAKSKILPQLETLDLAYGILTDASIETFVKYKRAFEHLKVLDVGYTYLTKDGAKKLQGIAKSLNTEHIRGGDEYDDDPEYRYVWVGE